MGSDRRSFWPAAISDFSVVLDSPETVLHPGARSTPLDGVVHLRLNAALYWVKALNLRFVAGAVSKFADDRAANVLRGPQRLFDRTIVLWSADSASSSSSSQPDAPSNTNSNSAQSASSKCFEKGTYEYSFALRLPNSMPASVSTPDYHVHYLLLASIVWDNVVCGVPLPFFPWAPTTYKTEVVVRRLPHPHSITARLLANSPNAAGSSHILRYHKEKHELDRTAHPGQQTTPLYEILSWDDVAATSSSPISSSSNQDGIAKTSDLVIKTFPNLRPLLAECVNILGSIVFTPLGVNAPWSPPAEHSTHNRLSVASNSSSGSNGQLNPTETTAANVSPTASAQPNSTPIRCAFLRYNLFLDRDAERPSGHGVYSSSVAQDKQETLKLDGIPKSMNVTEQRPVIATVTTPTIWPLTEENIPIQFELALEKVLSQSSLVSGATPTHYSVYDRVKAFTIDLVQQETYSYVYHIKKGRSVSVFVDKTERKLNNFITSRFVPLNVVSQTNTPSTPRSFSNEPGNLTINTSDWENSRKSSFLIHLPIGNNVRQTTDSVKHVFSTVRTPDDQLNSRVTRPRNPELDNLGEEGQDIDDDEVERELSAQDRPNLNGTSDNQHPLGDGSGLHFVHARDGANDGRNGVSSDHQSVVNFGEFEDTDVVKISHWIRLRLQMSQSVYKINCENCKASNQNGVNMKNGTPSPSSDIYYINAPIVDGMTSSPLVDGNTSLDQEAQGGDNEKCTCGSEDERTREKPLVHLVEIPIVIFRPPNAASSMPHSIPGPSLKNFGRSLRSMIFGASESELNGVTEYDKKPSFADATPNAPKDFSDVNNKEEKDSSYGSPIAASKDITVALNTKGSVVHGSSTEGNVSASGLTCRKS